MSGDQRIECVQGDITRQRVDALVNAANEALRGGGGVDGAIHRAAGPGLLAELARRYPEGCPRGEARISGGHGLAARFVIHTVGPIWRGGERGEPQRLAACHRASLELAAEHGLASLAFPAISCGVYGYPPQDAARVAVRTVAEGLERQRSIECVRFVLFDAVTLGVFERALRGESSR